MIEHDIVDCDNVTQCDCMPLVLATGLDRHFGSGYGSEPNRRQIGGPGRQYTRTVDSGTIPSTSPYPSELGGFPAGCTASPSVNSYNMLAFAIRV